MICEKVLYLWILNRGLNKRYVLFEYNATEKCCDTRARWIKNEKYCLDRLYGSWQGECGKGAYKAL